MNKKLTIKRIIIFTVLAYIFTFVWDIIFLYLPDSPSIYDDPENASPYSSFAGFSMFGPALAAFVTRFVTKEGMENSMLKFNIKGNVKYYILPIAALMAVTLINAISMPIVSGAGFYFGNDFGMIAAYFLNVVLSNVFLIGLYFGEEYGWRAYLFPKLEEVMGTGKALIITGIIWGVWHTPVLLKGHNFGKDMPFFPISNIILMCILCFFTAPIFSYFAKKCNSVWPAAIAHAFFNNFTGQAQGIFCPPDADEYVSSIAVSLNMFIGLAIVGIFFFILMVRDSKNGKDTLKNETPQQQVA
ncbi:MAG: CPBP family intramembrane glutamic endopeptidase [Huintestinicola sp.]